MEKEMFETLIGKDEIETRIGELAAKIDYDYSGEEVVVVPVLKGGMIFACSLMLELKSTPVVVDYIDVSSYGNNTSSMGEVIPKKWLGDSVCDKNVLIVDDIIDSGRTLDYIKNRIISEERPKSIKLCTLLNKPSRREFDIEPNYIGFDIEDVFVAGYGLDYKEHERNKPFIVKVKQFKGN